jgi:predicted cupin superfamily sugar epimerase
MKERREDNKIIRMFNLVKKEGKFYSEEERESKREFDDEAGVNKHMGKE